MSWSDCQQFIATVNAQLKCGARLPTEAEWEYACRAGSNGEYGSTGMLSAIWRVSIDDIGWYSGNSNDLAHPVGKKKSNAWGFHDMHGNVWEWCQDRYGAYNRDATDPQSPASDDDRVLRGCCWYDFARFCRSADHFRNTPGNRDYSNGFRLCCSIPMSPVVNWSLELDIGNTGNIGNISIQTEEGYCGILKLWHCGIETLWNCPPSIS